MKKIFLNQGTYQPGDLVFITGEHYHHLARVLRAKLEERILISDSDGNEFDGRIKKIDHEKIEILLGDRTMASVDKIPEITVLFSVLKGDKNELLIQKCTELGVSRFLPVITQNTIVKITPDETRKQTRWSKIAQEAAMQSGRHKIPEILTLKTFDDLKNYDIKGEKYYGSLLEKDKRLLAVLKKEVSAISFFVGPEGDFSREEIDFLNQWGWQGVSISDCVLKSDTAGILAAALIYSFYWSF